MIVVVPVIFAEFPVAVARFVVVALAISALCASLSNHVKAPPAFGRRRGISVPTIRASSPFISSRSSAVALSFIVTVSLVGSKEKAVFVCVTALSLAGQYPAERAIVNVSTLLVAETISRFVTTAPLHASSVRRKVPEDGKSAHSVAVHIHDVAPALIVPTISVEALFLCL